MGNMAIFVLMGLFYIAVLVAMIWAYVKIITKAGYSGWWVLITLVPIANIVMFFVFAFRKWPIEEQLEATGRRFD